MYFIYLHVTLKKLNIFLIPDAVIWLFSVLLKHPLTWSQYSSAQYGKHMPPHLEPNLPAGQGVHNLPKYPGEHAAVQKSILYSINNTRIDCFLKKLPFCIYPCK